MEDQSVFFIIRKFFIINIVAVGYFIAKKVFNANIIAINSCIIFFFLRSLQCTHYVFLQKGKPLMLSGLDASLTFARLADFFLT